MRRRSVTCSDCGSTWPAATARFCGRCGQPLRLPVASPGTAGTRGLGRRARNLLITVLLSAAAVLLLTSVPAMVEPLTHRMADGADGEVALPPPELIEEAEPPDPSRSAPRPMSCLASDCVAWRTPLDTQDGAVVIAGGLVVALTSEDGRLVALDAETGARRWETGVWRTPALERRDGGDRDERGWRLFPTDDGVFVTGPGWVRLIDREGRHRWSAPALLDTWWSRTTDGTVLFHGQASDGLEGGEPHEHIIAYDVSTGRPRWERHVSDTPRFVDEVDAVVVLTARDRLGRLDTRTGEVRWEVEVTGGWAPLIGAQVLATLPDGRRMLVDPADGELRPPPFSQGGEIYGLRSLDDLHVVMLVEADPEQRRREEGTEIEVIALDDDAEVRWRHRSVYLHGGGDCCPALVLEDSEVVLRGNRVELVLDAASGERLRVTRRSEPSRDERVAALPEGTQVTQREDGVEIRTATGTFILQGDPDAWVVSTEPMVVAGGGELLGLQAPN